jgi:sugar/nucleoside kinase (ribokinase family)
MDVIDYLVAGYVTRDLTPTGYNAGGTAAYSGRTADMLGCKTAVITSTVPNEPALDILPDSICLFATPSEYTSTYDNIYTPQGRQQIIHQAANKIMVSDYPDDWPEPTVLHLGPVGNEVDVNFAHRFSNSVIGLTPQGWMRRWGEDGKVYLEEWQEAEEILPLATAVILSEEDLLDKAMLTHFRELSRLMVLTSGYNGCTVFIDEDMVHIPAPQVKEVEPTGAGDIFATAFLVKYQQSNGDYREAGRFANMVASQSVTHVGLDAKIKHIQNHLQEIGEL